jgi:hypothetical protein
MIQERFVQMLRVPLLDHETAQPHSLAGQP